MISSQAKRLQTRLGVVPDGQLGLGPVTYAALFARLGRPGGNAAAFGRGAAKHFPAFNLDKPLRLAYFLAQIHVESAGFSRLTENLDYLAKRLCKVWPSRFPTLASAMPDANNPEALAKKVCGGRMGNVNPGDGFRYLRRSLKMITGRENMASCARRTGLDLVNHPELAADPEHSILIACDYWNSHGLNLEADRDLVVDVTKAINGGHHGLAARKEVLVRAKALTC